MIQNSDRKRETGKGGNGDQYNINTLVPNIGKQLSRKHPYAPYANKLAKKKQQNRT